MLQVDSKDVFFTDSGKQVNGDTIPKKHSITESVHSKARSADGEDKLVLYTYFFGKVQ